VRARGKLTQSHAAFHSERAGGLQMRSWFARENACPGMGFSSRAPMAHDGGARTARKQGADMRNEQVSDTLFNRRALGREALQHDADQVAPAFADPAITEAVTRANCGLRSMAASRDAHSLAPQGRKRLVAARVGHSASLQHEIREFCSIVSGLSQRSDALSASPARGKPAALHDVPLTRDVPANGAVP
jgi:hypothetical protein